MSLCLNLPINSVSFGQISTLILKSLFDRQKNILLFPIGNQIDLSTQEVTKDFIDWLNYSVSNNSEIHNRNNKIFKLWHLNGSLESLSKEQILLSFYELDQPTKTELNIVKNNLKVFFTSQYTCDIFKAHGCTNTEYVPLPFDSYNFKKLDKKYMEDRITFNLLGKLEKRKNHKKVIQSWLKKYGNNRKYFLQCAIFNPFIKREDQQALISQILEGKDYFNINFMNFIQNNSLYNDFLNSGDIVLGMSGGEGWGLPEFHSVGLGKHSVILNAHGYKGWANEKNSVLVEPTEKIEAYDNIFFHKGGKFNQGNIFTFSEESFIDGCEKAIKRFEASQINKNGLDIQKDFTINKFTDRILNLYA